MNDDGTQTIGGRLGSGSRGLRCGLGIFFNFNKIIFGAS
jgi:hypothetical protein